MARWSLDRSRLRRAANLKTEYALRTTCRPLLVPDLALGWASATGGARPAVGDALRYAVRGGFGCAGGEAAGQEEEPWALTVAKPSVNYFHREHGHSVLGIRPRQVTVARASLPAPPGMYLSVNVPIACGERVSELTLAWKSWEPLRVIIRVRSEWVKLEIVQIRLDGMPTGTESPKSDELDPEADQLPGHRPRPRAMCTHCQWQSFDGPSTGLVVLGLAPPRSDLRDDGLGTLLQVPPHCGLCSPHQRRANATRRHVKPAMSRRHRRVW